MHYGIIRRLFKRGNMKFRSGLGVCLMYGPYKQYMANDWLKPYAAVHKTAHLKMALVALHGKMVPSQYNTFLTWQPRCAK